MDFKSLTDSVASKVSQTMGEGAGQKVQEAAKMAQEKGLLDQAAKMAQDNSEKVAAAVGGIAGQHATKLGMTSEDASAKASGFAKSALGSMLGGGQPAPEQPAPEQPPQ